MNFSTMVEARSDPNFKHNLFAISFLQIHNIYICCCQLFISGNFYFSFVSTLLAYTAIPKNKRKIKTKIIRDKKLTTTYILYDDFIYHICQSRVINLKPSTDEPIKM